MIVLGITGQSGSGKGEVAKYLSSMGFSVIDADAVYHNIITPPSKCLDELVFHFGKGIITAGGLLNRKSLAAMVFGKENTEKLLLLNEITHKHVCREIRKILSSMKAMGCDLALIDAPLLIESGLDADCDFIISVVADRSIRLERIIRRDKISEEMAQKRVDSQKPAEFYIEKSDFLIENNGDINSLCEQVKNILISKDIINGNN